MQMLCYPPKIHIGVITTATSSNMHNQQTSKTQTTCKTNKHPSVRFRFLFVFVYALPLHVHFFIPEWQHHCACAWIHAYRWPNSLKHAKLYIGIQRMRLCILAGRASMSKPPAKKRAVEDGRGQLVALHRGEYLSQRALEKVLRQIRDEGLPDAVSRRSQGRALTAFGDTPTPDGLGPVVQDIELPLTSGPFSVAVQMPMQMLSLCVLKSATFRAFMRERLRLHPSSMARPWGIIVYFDAISPKDPLAKGKDAQKVEAIYWSFEEFGVENLWSEILWFVVSATRQVVVKSLPGAMSENVGIILDHCFSARSTSAGTG